MSGRAQRVSAAREGESVLGKVIGHGLPNKDGETEILSMQSTIPTALPRPPPMTEEEGIEEEMRRLTNPDSTRTLPDVAVAPDNPELNRTDAFVSDDTGTTEDKRDSTDPGPTSGPKFTTPSGQGGVIDPRKGGKKGTTGPGLMTLGKRKRRKTKRRTKRRKMRSSGTRKSTKSRRTHKTRSKKRISRRSNKTRKSRK